MPESPVETEHDTKRRRILDAAVGAFRRGSYGKVRISDVAEAAGVGKGTVYEYFRSKEELLLEAALSCCRNTEADIFQELGVDLAPEEAIPALVEKYGPAAALYRLLKMVFRGVTVAARENLPVYMQLWAVCRDQPEMLDLARDRLQELYEGWEGNLVQLQEAGVQTGSFVTGQDQLCLPAQFTAVLDGLAWQLTFRPDLDLEALAEATARNYLYRLLKDPAGLEELAR